MFTSQPDQEIPQKLNHHNLSVIKMTVTSYVIQQLQLQGHWHINIIFQTNNSTFVIEVFYCMHSSVTSLVHSCVSLQLWSAGECSYIHPILKVLLFTVLQCCWIVFPWGKTRQRLVFVLNNIYQHIGSISINLLIPRILKSLLLLFYVFQRTRIY